MKLLDPKNDAVFKMLFAKKGNEDILISLITAIIKPHTPVKTIKVLNPEIPKNHIDDKGTLLDILVELEDKHQINIEMQMNWHRYLEQRAYYYAAKLYASQLKRGFKYEKLRPTITVFLLRDIAFKEAPNNHFHYIFSMRERNKVADIKEMIQIHFIEISKFFGHLQKKHKKNNQQLLANWCQFLYNPSEVGLSGEEPPMDAIKKALKSLEEISADEDAREIARVREKARLDFESEVHGAKLEGVEIGRAEGEVTAKQRLLEKLLENTATKNMSDKDLADLTGLSIEEVKSLRQD